MDLFAQKQDKKNATSLLPGPARPSQAALGVNKPLQTWAGSALHSSPQQVLASAPITHRVIRNCQLSEVLLSPEPQVTESWFYTQFIALVPPLNSSTREQKCSWPRGRLLSPFITLSSTFFKYFLKHRFKIKSIYSNITLKNGQSVTTSAPAVLHALKAPEW